MGGGVCCLTSGYYALNYYFVLFAVAVKKLVMETFHNLWFTPVKEKPSLDIESLQRKVSNITDVVAASQDVGTEFFESLLDSVSVCKFVAISF
jgi:hypothetical protein